MVRSDHDFFSPARQGDFYGLGLNTAIITAFRQFTAARLLVVTKSSFAAILDFLRDQCVATIIGLKKHFPRRDVFRFGGAILEKLIDMVIGVVGARDIGCGNGTQRRWYGGGS